MTTGKLLSTLLLLIFCIEYSYAGVKKIKIHVPYYVKHVHHYKKVYVPKIHVIKHEHHHKKEYDHHHHHHDVFKRGPYRSYDKSSHEFPDEFGPGDVYYDDIESKSHRGGGRRRIKPIRFIGHYSKQFKGWRDVDGSDYSGEDEEDYGTYGKNYYFKRRSGVAEDDAEDKERDKEENNEEDEEDEDEEEEEEGQETEDSTTSLDNAIISITTTENPLGDVSGGCAAPETSPNLYNNGYSPAHMFSSYSVNRICGNSPTNSQYNSPLPPSFNHYKSKPKISSSRRDR